MVEDNNNSILTQYLEKISISINEMKSRHESYSDEKCIFAYRGESKDFGETTLMPSIFREKGDVTKEKYLFELLSDYGFMNSQNTSKIEQAIESQHFLALSRMLDISFSVLPALYFACEGHEDGYLFVFAFPEYYSPHSQYIEEFYSQVLEGETNITYSGNFKVISHSFSNERIKAQVGGFIFFPGTEYKPISDIYYRQIPVRGEDKAQIIEELETFFNVKEDSLFPEKDKIAKSIRKKFKEKKYNNAKISCKEEVEVFLNHIEYELAMMVRGEHEVKQNISRMLRKEESDLIFYVSHCNIEKNQKNLLIKDIEEKFYYWERKYGRRK